MRILYVINGLDPGGAEHGLATLVESGAFDGHDLRVIAFCRGRGDLAERITSKLGWRIHFVTNSETLTLRACAAAFFEILLALRAFRPQKMVLSLKQANVVGRLAALLVPGLTCVAFEHTPAYRAQRFQGLYEPFLRLLSARVDEVWADCTKTLEESSRYFRPRHRTGHVIPLFVADKRTPFKVDYALGPHLRIAVAGRLIALKNVPLMIDVMSALHGEGVEALLEVYGDGPQKQALQTLIGRRGLEDRVTLHGYRADWATEAIAADIFLNLSSTEGFCIVVAEAMLAGLPVVAVDAGGIREYGRDNENMLKLAAPDVDAVRAAVVRLTRNLSLRERLGRQARADMLGKYDHVRCRQQMARALSTVRENERPESA